MNPLRIFARLREAERRLDFQRDATRELNELLERRLRERSEAMANATALVIKTAIAEHDRKTAACAACGGIVDIEKVREHGPSVMEKRIDGNLTKVIVCYECEPYAKRNDWRRSKPTAADAEESPRPTLVPPPNQESAS
jgi:hypothetical protein